jgi:hypothetical protein
VWCGELGNADVSFTFPSEQRESEVEVMDVQFDWAPTTFSQWHNRLHHSVATKGQKGQQMDKDQQKGDDDDVVEGRKGKGLAKVSPLEALFCSSDATELLDPDTTLSMTELELMQELIFSDVDYIPGSSGSDSDNDVELLMFALPHHQVSRKRGR